MILAIRTGSADWNRAMMAWLKSTNNPAWRIRDGALWRDGLCFHDGQQDWRSSMVGLPYDRRIQHDANFQALTYVPAARSRMVGLPYVEPSQRETMRDFQLACA